MGPFCPEQGTSSHDTVIDLALTDEIVILLTDEVGAMEIYKNRIIFVDVKMYYILPDNSVVVILVVIVRPLMSIPYIPLRPRIQ